MSKFIDSLGNLTASWQLGIGGARVRSNAGTVETRTADNSALAPFSASQIRSPSVSELGVRQTVLTGSVDSSGLPNALSIGSGLAVSLSAASTAMLLSFAAGFDGNGQIDYAGQFTSNQTFSSLTASTTCFLYVDRNTSTGALTLGFSTLTPIYSRSTPSSPSTDQHWFSPATYVMQRWNGSAWAAVQRVFVGEAVTGASTVTSVDTYAYSGLFVTGWFAVTTGTNYSKKHYLGMSIADANALVSVFTSTSSTGASNVAIAPTFVSNMTAFYGYLPKSTLINSRQGTGFFTGANGVHYDDGSGNWVTSAYYNIIFKRGW